MIYSKIIIFKKKTLSNKPVLNDSYNYILVFMVQFLLKIEKVVKIHFFFFGLTYMQNRQERNENSSNNKCNDLLFVVGDRWSTGVMEGR